MTQLSFSWKASVRAEEFCSKAPDLGRAGPTTDKNIVPHMRKRAKIIKRLTKEGHDGLVRCMMRLMGLALRLLPL